MTSMVAVIAGPARSGKTQRLLGQYRQVLSSDFTAPSDFTGRCLWIAPTTRMVREVRDRLLAPELPACFRPGVMTFDQVAEVVLHNAPDAGQPISNSTRRLIVRGLIRSALAAGQLRHFAPIADSQGLLDLVVSFIAEMKRIEVWPHEFAAACAQGDMTEKDRQLHNLYAAYQDVLNTNRLYDQQGRFWSARTRLQQGQGPPFEKLDLLVVDGFTDFTRTQHEILQVLAGRSRETRISLPLDRVSGDGAAGSDGASGRDDLFDKPRRTLAALQDRHPNLSVERGLSVEEVPRDTKASRSAIAHLESELFKGPHRSPPWRSEKSSAQPSVEVLSVSRRLGEIEEIGRRVKRLIIEKNVPPGDIGVVFRSLRESAPLVREVFDELGIPLSIDEHLTLGSAPVLRSVAMLVRLAVEDWPFRLVVEAINNDYLRADDDSPTHWLAAAAAERLVRHLQIPSGRAALLRQVEKWAQGVAVDQVAGPEDAGQTPTPTDDAAIDEQDWPTVRHRLAVRALPLLRRLAELTEGLPERGTHRQWAEALTTLAERAGLLFKLPAPRLLQTDESVGKSLWKAARVLTDHRAWQLLQEILSAGDQVSTWLGQGDAERSRDEFFALLLDLLHSVPLPSVQDETGCVQILAAPSVRGLRFPHLFVAGLSEKAFPAPQPSDRLYSDAELRRLMNAGLPLVDRRQSTRDEMLQFYEVVTRAGEHLTLSYPAHDEKAEPLSPSPYVAEVERLFDSDQTPGLVTGMGRAIRHDLHHLSPIPQSPQPLSPAELRVCAVSRAMSGDHRLLAGLAHGPANDLPSVAHLWQPMAAGLHAVEQRFRGERFGCFEGIIQGDEAQRMIADRFGPDAMWSPSRLEQYASCPYQFFLDRVLRLAPLDDLSLDVDYRGRGQLLHAALASVHRKLNELSESTSSPADLDPDVFLEEVEVAIRALIEATPAGGDVGATLQELDGRQVRQWLGQYHPRHADYDRLSDGLDSPLRPAHFEVRFGPDRHGPVEQIADEQEDSRSTDQPFELEVDSERILITGRIDRIDLGMAAGWPVFNIIDYKSGKSDKLKSKDIESGDALQLPLYAMAVEQLLLAGKGAVPWQMGYWFMEGPGFDKRSIAAHQQDESTLEPTDTWQTLRPRILSRVQSLIDGVRAANFPVENADEHCTGRCDFNKVCRVAQARAVGKTWVPLCEDAP